MRARQRTCKYFWLAGDTDSVMEYYNDDQKVEQARNFLTEAFLTLLLHLSL